MSKHCYMAIFSVILTELKTGHLTLRKASVNILKSKLSLSQMLQDVRILSPLFPILSLSASSDSKLALKKSKFYSFE